MNTLEQIKTMTTVVADTGDYNAVKKYTPTDATTNPSLIYKAAQIEEYQHLIDEAIAFGQRHSHDPAEQMDAILDKAITNFGRAMLDIIPGRVSTEVDARLSFDIQGSIDKARRYIALYEQQGIDRERILIKLASTWEGIRAAEQLEKEGIHCNLTLLFNYTQAIACAEAGVTLVSPFVGRIMDWFKTHEGVDGYPAAEDPGVKSVTRTYNYFKKFGYKTQVMGASFRNSGEIIELAGCDLLTIAPALLEELHNMDIPVVKKLDAQLASEMEIEKIHIDEKRFRWDMNEDAMATEKLAEGIRGFTADLLKLEKLITQRMAATTA